MGIRTLIPSPNIPSPPSIGGLDTTSNASSSYDEKRRARAAVKESDSAPTAGKNIPIFVGAIKRTGDVIWIRTFRNSKGACMCDVAVCFGRNIFSRSIKLSALSQDGVYIYRRDGGAVVDTPSSVTFYDGTHTGRDPTIVEHEGAENTPAYRGYIYAVLTNVKLGDFTAEMTDNGTTDIGPSEVCDPDLAGVDLVADPSTGLFYGIEFPMSGNSNIITSDGCRVLNRVPITRNIELPGKPGSDIIYADNIFPLECTGFVAITYFQGYFWELGGDDNEPSIDLFRPSTGSPISSERPINFNLQLAKSSVVSASSSPSTEIQHLLSYPLPGESGGAHFVLRLFDRSDCWALTEIANFGGDPLPGSGNICGTVLCTPHVLWTDYQYELAFIYKPGDPYYPFAHPGAGGWWTVDAPVVDDIIHCKNLTSSAILGAYRQSGSDITVYWLEHTRANGLVATATVTISGQTATGLAYDETVNKILVSTSSDRVYEVTESGHAHYSIPAGSQLAGPRHSVSAGNNHALFNASGSAAWGYVSNGGGTYSLYSGQSPTDTPFIDLTRDQVTLPVVTGWSQFSTGQINFSNIPVENILTDICTYKGYDVADLYFENLSDRDMKGIIITDTIKVSDLFNRLGALYGFVFVETDRKLKFLKKWIGTTVLVDVALTEDDLVDLGDGDGSRLRMVERSGSNNVLSGMTLEFINTKKRLENDRLIVRRPTGTYQIGSSSRVESLSVPISLPTAKARSLLSQAFYSAILKETRAVFAVPSWHARIEPGDCISVTVNGVETIGVAVRCTFREDFSQEIEIETYITDGSTVLDEVVDDNPVDDVDTMIADHFELDIPLISASHYTGVQDFPLYHAFANRSGYTWGGVDLYRSFDGATFEKIIEYDGYPAVVARAENALGVAPLPFSVDDVNSLTITPLHGDTSVFASVTYEQMMNGETYLAIGRPGRHGLWEIIGFQDVVANIDGTFTLSNLLRGLFGTDHIFDAGPAGYAFEHQVGDSVVVLRPGSLSRTNYKSAQWNVNARFGVATPTSAIEENGAVAWYMLGGIPMIPLRPCHIRGEHAPGSANLVVSWEPRSRIPGEWGSNGSDVTMPDEAESYNLRIETTSGNFEFSNITARTYTWTAFGSTFSTTTRADAVITGIFVSQVTSLWGSGPEEVGPAYDT